MLPEFRLEIHYARWEFAARYNAAASDLETLRLTELLALADDAGRAAWDELSLGYIPTTGTPALREAIAATHDACGPDDVLTFAGAEEGIFCAMHALLGPGDHAVVLAPNYQSMEEVPRSLAEVTGVALRPENNWSLDLDEVRRALRPTTRMIAVNFPNNPTGMLPDATTFEGLVALAADRGVWLFSDEVYRGLERAPATTLPLAADRYERALSLGVASKALGLAGLRVGWIVCRDRALLARMERVKHWLSICNAGPSEALAAIALRARDRILARNRAIVAAGLEALESFMARHADRFEWYRPLGGCVAFPRYRGAEGVEALCRRAVEQAGVILLPANLFRSAVAPVPEDRFRIGYGRRDLPEALAALEPVLAPG